METDNPSEGKQFPPVSGQSSPDLDLAGFPARLKLAREKAGFRSARALSQAIDVSDSNIRQYEKGEQEPKMSVLMRLARACQVSAEWLASGKGPMEYLSVGTVTPHGHVVVQGPTALFDQPSTEQKLSIRGEKIDPDRLGRALREAEIMFAANRKRPTDRDLILAMVIYYNRMTEIAEQFAKTSKPDNE